MFQIPFPESIMGSNEEQDLEACQQHQMQRTQSSK